MYVPGSRRFIAYGNDHDGSKKERHFFKRYWHKRCHYQCLSLREVAMVANCAFVVAHRFFTPEFLALRPGLEARICASIGNSCKLPLLSIMSPASLAKADIQPPDMPIFLSSYFLSRP
jgi:hypothetical protein